MFHSIRHSGAMRAGARLVSVLALFALVFPAASAFADPPSWAPAHGYRDKHGRDRDRDYRHERRERHDRSWRHEPTRYVAMPDMGAGTCNRELLGTVLGGTAGGAIGSQFGKGDGRTAAIVVGAIIGGIVGGNVGRSMDQVDTQCVGQALESAPNGRPVVWHNPDDGNAYSITPRDTYKTASGQFCREYSATAMVGGRQQEITGTACRQADGSWKIVK